MPRSNCRTLVIAATITTAFALSANAQGTFQGRKAWSLKNSTITLKVLPGGGHIAGLTLNNGPAKDLNPFWVPPWKSVEPGVWKSDPAAWGGMPATQLLSSIMGHNICVDFFGGPSKPETAAGMPVHGEAPALNWKAASSSSTKLTYGTYLPMAQMHVNRTITLSKNSGLVKIDEDVHNTTGIDRPFGWQQHATLGPPFVAKGESVFDFGGTWSMVYPKEFSKGERLKRGEEFEWPNAPGKNGETIDLRPFPGSESKNSDFTATLASPDSKWAWFTAINKKKGLLIGYAWPRNIWPWIANWEENHFRDGKPWGKKGLARGVEFGTTPWADSRRDMVTLGKLNDTPTYRWISAKEKQNVSYYLFVAQVPKGTTGVEGVSVSGSTVSIKLAGGRTVKLSMN
jgi:hypothetical protein